MEVVKLKVNASVILLKNLDVEKGTRRQMMSSIATMVSYSSKAWQMALSAQSLDLTVRVYDRAPIYTHQQRLDRL